MADGEAQGLRNARNLDAALVAFGLAMLWPLLRAPFLLTVLVFDPVTQTDPHLVFDCAFAFGGLLLMVFASRLGRAFRLEKLPYATAACAALLCVVGVSLAGSRPIQPWLGATGSFALAAGTVLLFVFWAFRVTRLDIGRASRCITLSFLLSFAFGAFDYSAEALHVLSYVMPMGSAAFLVASYVWLAKMGSAVDARASEGEASGVGEANIPASGATSNRVGLRLVSDGHGRYDMLLCFIAVGLVASAVVRSLWMFETSSYQMKPSLVPTYVISVSLALSYLVVILLSKAKTWGLLLGLAFTMLTLFVGIILCAVLGQAAGLGAIASAHTSFEFLLWAFFVLTATGKGTDLLRGLGLWLLAEGVTSLLASNVLPGLLGINESTTSDLSLVIALISMTLIAVSFVGLAIILLREINAQLALSQKPEPIASAEQAQAVAVADFELQLAAALIEAYGLTEREAQVAACVARGNSVKRTAELLYIAPSTVQGYMKSIYRKMGINRKQSLVDIAGSLVDAQFLNKH